MYLYLYFCMHAKQNHLCTPLTLYTNIETIVTVKTKISVRRNLNTSDTCYTVRVHLS